MTQQSVHRTMALVGTDDYCMSSVGGRRASVSTGGAMPSETTV
jgi:hypothetical protein